MNGGFVMSPDIGERVRMLRVASGRSQTALSESLGLKGNTVVSKVETGRMPVDHELAASIASALDCSVEFLTRPYEPCLATKPWLRAYADASAKVVEQVLGDNLLAYEFVSWSRMQWVPDSLPQFDGDPNDDDAIEAFANHVRSIADIPEDGVVRNAVRAAERLGCSVLPLESELGRHLGLSQRINDRPFIRLSRAWNSDRSHQVPGDRQRFTVSHELGHLVLHAEVPPPVTPDEAKRLERQAHRFAAAFLAPAEPLLDDWAGLGGRATLRVLQQLKATWGVAIKMLVMRFRQLGVIDDDHARSLYRQISARGWNKAEPVEVSNEEPVWFDRALKRAFPRATREETIAAAAEHFGLAVSHIARWTTWEVPEGVPSEVATLTPRGTTEYRPPSPEPSAGTLIQLPSRGQRLRLSRPNTTQEPQA